MINIDESSRMSAYMAVTPDKQIHNLQRSKANSMGRSFPVLSISLSDEEKEQQLNTIDNGMKAVDVLNRIENSISPSEQVAVTNGWEEYDRFVEKIFNLPLAEIKEIPSDNGILFLSGLDLNTAEAPESTSENPIMYVSSGNRDQMDFTWYKIYINQVNPRSATREEMFALITYENRDSEQALLQATYAWHDLNPYGMSDGQIDFIKELEYSFALTARAYKGGDMRAKNAYYALMDMIDKLGKRTDQQTKPSQTTIYHKLAVE
jgi:hypothetical protein